MWYNIYVRSIRFDHNNIEEVNIDCYVDKDLKGKINLFWDVDDTILNSSEAVIAILNKRYNLNKTYNDLTDFYYKSIYGYVTKEEISEIYDSEEFFNIVTPKMEFVEFYNQNKRKYNFFFVTKGTKRNLLLKKDFLQKYFPKAKYIGLDLNDSDLDCSMSRKYNKSAVDMNNGIQIDDIFPALEGTNANCKILLTNGKKLSYNKKTTPLDNLYETKNMSEVIEIIEFINDNQKLMMERTWNL